MKPTETQVRARFETDLSDAALQILIDAADEDVVSQFGPHASQIDTFLGGFADLHLSRPALDITSVVETVGDTDTTLASDDYELRENGWFVRRLDDGTNVRSTWGREVVVTYTPESDARRLQAIIDLVILEAQYSGLDEQWSGDLKEMSNTDHEVRRRAILRSLMSKRRLVA